MASVCRTCRSAIITIAMVAAGVAPAASSGAVAAYVPDARTRSLLDYGGDSEEGNEGDDGNEGDEGLDGFMIDRSNQGNRSDGGDNANEGNGENEGDEGDEGNEGDEGVDFGFTLGMFAGPGALCRSQPSSPEPHELNTAHAIAVASVFTEFCRPNFDGHVARAAQSAYESGVVISDAIAASQAGCPNSFSCPAATALAEAWAASSTEAHAIAVAASMQECGCLTSAPALSISDASAFVSLAVDAFSRAERSACGEGDAGGDSISAAYSRCAATAYATVWTKAIAEALLEGNCFHADARTRILTETSSDVVVIDGCERDDFSFGDVFGSNDSSSAEGVCSNDCYAPTHLQLRLLKKTLGMSSREKFDATSADPGLSCMRFAALHSYRTCSSLDFGVVSMTATTSAISRLSCKQHYYQWSTCLSQFCLSKPPLPALYHCRISSYVSKEGLEFRLCSIRTGSIPWLWQSLNSPIAMQGASNLI